MTLKDSWKQQCQQETTQRRQQVSEALAIAHKERQKLASAFCSDLNLVRPSLAKADRNRTLEFQRFYVELHQHRVELRRETQEFLTSVSDHRHSQSQQVASQLRKFVQALQVQTADFLAVTEVERQVMAQQLANDLQTFRAVLGETVSVLRQDIQAEIQDLQLETQSLLSQSRQQRFKIQIRLTHNLAAFTENLRLEVHHYLSDMETARRDRAATLAQTLHQSRIDRETENRALFSRLADSRSQLRQYRAELKSAVWGEDSTPEVISEPVVQQPSPVPETSFTRPALKLSTPTLSVIQKSVQPVERIETQKPQSLSLVEVEPAVNSVDDRTFEEKVYQYIDLLEGARLTEIESVMGISRFQAVDTLRSLIQKGLVTQRDRVYRIQEDFTVRQG